MSFDALSGAYVATWNGENTPAGSFGNTYVSVAAHNASGDVYVTDSAHEVTDVFGPGGEYLTQITESATGTGGGVGTAVDQANANVYVSDNEAKVAWVFDALFVPDVATSAATGVRPTSVTLNGDVDPDGVPVTACFFEYGTDSSYGQSVPCTQSPGSGTSPVAVSADLSGLQEGVTYRYRLVAENANGANQSADAEVTTPAPPSIDSASAENLLSGSADLRAAIDPRAAATSYRFEYGTSTAYGASVPLPEGSIPAGLSDRTVIQHVTGLQANTTYHWRVVAQNIAGATVGADHTFVYDTSGEGLPDNRAYELVSPPRKNGALLGRAFAAPGLPEVAEDGSRVMTFSVQCFEASVACNANRGNNGDSYALTRTADGWTASEFAPPATQLETNDLLSYNANTDMALFSAQPIPGGQDHLYVEKSTGTVVNIGPAGPPGSGFRLYFEVAATPDYSHVVYGWDKEEHLWPFDATLERSLYEYVGVGNAQPTLVGVSGGPGSTDLISVCGTGLGSSNPYVPNRMSSDGSVVFFMASECASGSGANAGVAVSADTLYARIDESRTVLISGRSPRDCTGGCLTSTPQAANFWGASSDGSRAFFTSRQRLVDAASEGGENLYEYDSSRPEGENLSVVSAGDTSGEGPGVTGVEAISPDGSHVYFAATGLLTNVANSQGQLPQAGGENLYVYQRDAEYTQGAITFIATLPSSDIEFSSDLSGNLMPGFTGGPGLANVTPDGRFLVFLSRGRLTADDSSVSGAAQVFRYDAETGALVRISIGENGLNDNGNAGVEFGDADIVLAADGYPRTDPTMSHDGSYVFFESPVALTPHALNDVQIGVSPFFRLQPAFAQNVYEWHEGHVYLISDGRDTSALAPYSNNVSPSEALSSVTLLGSDATGANAFFTTADRLAPQDIDTQVDYYDARICSEQSPCIAASAPSGSGCAGEACRGTPAGAPSLGSPVSAAFAGAGNQTPSAAPVTKAKKQAQRKVKKRKARSRRPRHAAKHASRRTGIRQASRSTRRSK